VIPEWYTQSTDQALDTADLQELSRGADLVARHPRQVRAITVELPRLDAVAAESLERACTLMARGRDMDVEIWLDERTTRVRFAR
jgi:hypothetical protein